MCPADGPAADPQRVSGSWRQTAGRLPPPCARRPWQAFWRVALPLASPGFLSAAVLGFSHTVGNFGVVLMIGGNIPGRTRVMSTAVFDYVETMRWREANILAGSMVVFAFIVILSMILIEKRFAGSRI